MDEVLDSLETITPEGNGKRRRTDADSTDNSNDDFNDVRRVMRKFKAEGKKLAKPQTKAKRRLIEPGSNSSSDEETDDDDDDIDDNSLDGEDSDDSLNRFIVPNDPNDEIEEDSNAEWLPDDDDSSDERYSDAGTSDSRDSDDSYEPRDELLPSDNPEDEDGAEKEEPLPNIERKVKVTFP